MTFIIEINAIMIIINKTTVISILIMPYLELLGRKTIEEHK